jgi:hypothetical protein
VHTGLKLGKPKERDQLEDLDVDGRVIVEYNFKKLFAKVWNGLIWHRRGKSLMFVGPCIIVTTEE